MTGALEIDSARLMQELQQLATFSEPPAATIAGDDTAVTRIVFSPHDLDARGYLNQLAAEAGLEIREDAVGNTFFRWQGSEPALAAIATGSHVDAIPNAGMYDGTVGVLGGLEAIRALQAAGFAPRRSIELILFTSEEPTRFGIGCLGSRLMSGALTAEAAEQLTGKDGLSLEEARTHAGFAGHARFGTRLPGGKHTPPSSSCTSSRGPSSNAASFRSASSPPSPRPQARPSPSTVRAATREPC